MIEGSRIVFTALPALSRGINISQAVVYETEDLAAVEELQHRRERVDARLNPLRPSLS